MNFVCLFNSDGASVSSLIFVSLSLEILNALLQGVPIRGTYVG